MSATCEDCVEGKPMKPECELKLKSEIEKAIAQYEVRRKEHPFSEAEIAALARAVKPLITDALAPLQTELNNIQIGLRISRWWLAGTAGFVGFLFTFGPSIAAAVLAKH